MIETSPEVNEDSTLTHSLRSAACGETFRRFASSERAAARSSATIRCA